ncbi:MAG: rRNA pseudouridine synthase [Gammaproteobacteria bacterium]|nr:rRNA pseudouridine synthase [Gammaproteobacteria bacterium]
MKIPRPRPSAGDRVQKVLARAGLGSRREIETWIVAGRVTVNGKPATLGVRVSESDRIVVDGRPIATATPRPLAPRVLMLHKPAGTVCTRHDPDGRPTVHELLPEEARSRLIAVGRLDFTTSGLLLFTDDGELAHRLMHPRYAVMRQYAVRVFGGADETLLARLRQGVDVDGERLLLDAVTRQHGSGSNEWFTCTLRTGRNREVRRLWESQGCTVSRLIRVAFAGLQLPRGLHAGRWAELPAPELAALYALVDLTPYSTPTAPTTQRRSRKPSRSAPGAARKRAN